MLAKIEDAIEDIRNGRMVIVVDDEDRENEGDLVCAAEKVTPEIINFMAREGRGLICMPLTEKRLEELQISLQVPDPENTSGYGTAFCISIEAKRGVTTGISASDRATTILTAVDPKTKPTDLARPGHVFPLRARSGGVLVRPGQTEASVDLARIAGLTPAAVICEIMNDDGTMARLPQLRAFADVHDLRVISVADLIAYRMQTEVLVRRVAEADVPTPYGTFHGVAFENTINGDVHLAMHKGPIRPEPTLVRVHAQCLLGDVFGSLYDRAGWQLFRSLEMISDEGSGVVLYLNLRERSQELVHHLKGYAAFDPTIEGPNPPEVHGDVREYGVGAQILHALGLRQIRILSNHPRKLAGVEGFDIEVVGFVPIVRRDAADDAVALKQHLTRA
ncbi:MAG: 3,4-dihydroxy-2-butanone-4-phosphate synthase [Blastocatellia bacterium]|jgi:3,4-dihydroxy 2-butanone 4-phosphate synthase/GTP cyclohydrolase II|nr:3,4-dihydroxy-2-butanone-4-phosphate synthase [Blastocatellia bacterium]MBK6425115.1 3,4-dihydroxy-2-butanone-4-phosphate synthase [Blastocatellia bacterium]